MPPPAMARTLGFFSQGHRSAASRKRSGRDSPARGAGEALSRAAGGSTPWDSVETGKSSTSAMLMRPWASRTKCGGLGLGLSRVG